MKTSLALETQQSRAGEVKKRLEVLSGMPLEKEVEADECLLI